MKNLMKKYNPVVIRDEKIPQSWVKVTPEIRVIKPLPNVRKFKIKLLSDFHPIFLAKGIFKRQYEPLISSDPYNNKSLNRYLLWQEKRLNKLRDSPKKFWTVANYLRKESVSFQVYCLNSVLPNWHRNYPYGKVWKWLNLSISRIGKLNYRRIWLQEKTKARPLGVPIIPDRIHLHGLQDLLMIWLSPYHNENQHGFWKGQGTSTAWKTIHEKVLQSENIYEFDLKKFFDTINITYLLNLLREVKTPDWVLNELEGILRTLPENWDSVKPLSIGWTSEREKWLALKYKRTGIYELFYDEDIWSKDWLDLPKKEQQYEYYYGVPQGCPISPILANFVLDQTLLKTAKDIVQYADDGILYNHKDPETYLSTVFPPESNIQINWEKSKWIKRNGTWHSSLKFLGERFIPKELLEGYANLKLQQGGQLKSETRKGKSLLFEDYDLIKQAEAYDKSQENEKEESPSRGSHWSFIQWFKTKYFGFVTSRLYNGSMELDDIVQDFSYKFKTWSWSSLESMRNPIGRRYYGREEKIPLDTFNSSSFACRSLANRLKFCT